MTDKQESRENYLYYKQHHICPQCGVNHAAPHRVRCEECLAKNAESSQKSRDKKPVKISKKTYNKNLRDERKKKGLCIWCGKPQSSNSTCFCIDCRIKNQKKNDARKSGVDRSERPIYGICYRCGKNPIMPGKKLCEKCHEQSMNNLEYANSSTKTLERRAYIRQQNNAIFGRKEKPIGSNKIPTTQKEQ